MNAKLVVVGGEAESAEIQLILPTIIGRGRDASLTLPHPLVSRQHCEIYQSGGRLFVRDLGSLNGTYLNNERIEGDRELPDGELLTIGTVTFRAIYQVDRNDQRAGSEAAASGSDVPRDPARPADDADDSGKNAAKATQLDSKRGFSVPNNAATVQFSSDKTNDESFEHPRPDPLSPDASPEDETDHLGNALDPLC